MTIQHKHLIEKLQVLLAAAAGAAVGYYLFWPLTRPDDPCLPLTFLAAGQWSRLGTLALLALALAAVNGLLTFSARPESPILATLIGLAGAALHGGHMRQQLWQVEPARAEAEVAVAGYAPIFKAMAGETAVLLGLLLGMILVARLLRGLVQRIVPEDLLWVEIAPMDPHEEALNDKHPVGGILDTVVLVLLPWWARRKSARMADVPKGVITMVVEIALALLLLMLFFRSQERGQIAFALAASFFLATLFAHQCFPTREGLPIYLAPVLVGIGIYLLAWQGAGPGGTPPWRDALMVSSGLPIRAAAPMDWLTLGGSGAAYGLWVSRRVHEARRAEHEARSTANDQ